MPAQSLPRPVPFLQTLAIGIIAIVLFVAVSVWAGIPAHVPPGLFALGAGIFLISIILFGLAFWHLMVRPLPAGQAAQETMPIPAAYRKLIAALAAISGINIVIGGFWDEMWHRAFGLPFGEDLLWRPHMLLYFGFLSISALAGVALMVLLRRGSGSLQQRFRAQPVLGLLALVGGFLIFAIPSDPVWHMVYGEDITAWSLPHLILTISFAMIMFLAAAIQLTTVREKKWAGPLKIGASELLVVLVFAFMLTVLLQVLTTEWDVLSKVESGRGDAFWQRPVWLLPAVIAAVAAFTSAMSNQALRTYGAATLVAGSAFVVRFGLVTFLGVRQMTAGGWIVALAPALGVDLIYAFSMIYRKRPVNWLGGGLGAALGMALLGLPLINQLYVYPTIDTANLVGMLLAVLVASLGGAWMGQAVGDYLAAANKQLEAVEESKKLRLLGWIPGAAFIGVMVFIIFFMATAKQPG
jgi:hypothetical protein